MRNTFLKGHCFLLVVTIASAAWSQAGRTDPAAVVLDAARAQIGKTIFYDASYRRMRYPGGDVPLERGVCTDVLIRAFRAAGVDLQVLVHEDMTRAFEAYPKTWGLSRPDANIDHRRVPNLKVFFERRGRRSHRCPSGGVYRGRHRSVAAALGGSAYRVRIVRYGSERLVPPGHPQHRPGRAGGGHPVPLSDHGALSLLRQGAVTR